MEKSPCSRPIVSPTKCAWSTRELAPCNNSVQPCLRLSLRIQTFGRLHSTHLVRNEVRLWTPKGREVKISSSSSWVTTSLRASWRASSSTMQSCWSSRSNSPATSRQCFGVFGDRMRVTSGGGNRHAWFGRGGKGGCGCHGMNEVRSTHSWDLVTTSECDQS